MELLTVSMLTLYMGTMGVVIVAVLANQFAKKGTGSGRGTGKVVRTGVPYTRTVSRKPYASFS
jgi:hypothetical protein